MKSEEPQTSSSRPANPSSEKAKILSASELLTDMYYTQRSLDPGNVSLQSSFICMLHLANEKGLKFE